jgi:hypothetical protein
MSRVPDDVLGRMNPLEQRIYVRAEIIGLEIELQTCAKSDIPGIQEQISCLREQLEELQTVSKVIWRLGVH